jgi:hypothetical protein
VRPIRTALVGLCLTILVGCASTDPNAWVMYARANYHYGRIEAKAEMLCSRPRPPQAAEFCQEAEKVQQIVSVADPKIQAELTKGKADWAVIRQYLDLVLGLAAKAL